MVLIMKSDLWQVDDPLFLLSAHPLQSNHPAASNPSSAPDRCDTNPEVQSCLELLSAFELLLFHTGLRLSQCWSHSTDPLVPTSKGRFETIHPLSSRSSAS